MCFHGAFRGRVLCPRVCTAPSCSIRTDPEIAVESKPKSREGRSRGGGHRDSRPFLLFSADIDGGLGERRRGSVGFEEWGREPWRMMRYWKDRSRSEAIRGFRWKSTIEIESSRLSTVLRGNWISLTRDNLRKDDHPFIVAPDKKDENVTIQYEKYRDSKKSKGHFSTQILY